MIEHAMVHFHWQKTEPEYGGFAVAAMKHCSGCGQLIDGMGGGGTFLCRPCVRILSAGFLQREFAKAKEELAV